MKILVCVKQVPRLDQVRFLPGLNRIVREGVDAAMNPLDLQALGHALALRDAVGGEVVAATMGPPAAREVLAQALSAGADRAVHLVDMRFAGADTLATARALVQLCAREHPDLVLFGRSTVDGATAQVAPQVAELAGLPQVTHVITLSAVGGDLVVERELEQGGERWSVPLPAVVSIERGPVPAADGPVAGAVEELDADALGGDDAGYGIRGSATYVQRVLDAPIERSTRAVADPAEAAAQVHELAAGAAAPGQAGAAGSGQRELWVVAEEYGRGLHPVTLEGLAAANQVAERLDAAVVGVLLCGDAGALPAELGAYGADRVIVAQDPALATYSTEGRTAALTGLVRDRSPFAVIGPWTARGRDYLPRVAARLAMGMTGDVVGLDVDPHPGDDSVLDLVWLKPAWAGTVLARVVARTVPSFGTLRPGAVPALARREHDIPVEVIDVESAPAGQTPTRLASGHDAGASGLLDASRVLLCLGAGADSGTADLARQLGEANGWGVGGTSAAVANGLVSPQCELSMTKRSIAPALVIALGVTDPAELDAVRAARTLVTVTPDASAPVQAAADLAVAATPQAFLTELQRVPSTAGTGR